MTGAAVLIGLLLLALPASARMGDEADSVVLLHGLGRGPRSMKQLERRLGDAGFRAHNLDYPDRADSIEKIVADVHARYVQCCRKEGGRVHFVAHSLGGLVIRAYLAEHPPENLGRVVMLAPPNGGSEIVDRFRDWLLFRALLGPLAPQLGTGPEDLPARLLAPEYEVGVIAGDRWISPVGFFVLPGAHDGTVSVKQTRLAGMKDHLVVHHTHTFIMNSAEVADETVHFLRHGRFAHVADGADQPQSKKAKPPIHADRRR